MTSSCNYFPTHSYHCYIYSATVLGYVVSTHEKSVSTTTTLIARFMGPTWGQPGADRTQVGPMWATWTLLSGDISFFYTLLCGGAIIPSHYRSDPDIPIFLRSGSHAFDPIVFLLKLHFLRVIYVNFPNNMTYHSQIEIWRTPTHVQPWPSALSSRVNGRATLFFFFNGFILFSHYCEVTWALWQLFVYQLVQATMKWNIEASNHCYRTGGIYRRLVDSPHKGH